MVMTLSDGENKLGSNEGFSETKQEMMLIL